MIKEIQVLEKNSKKIGLFDFSSATGNDVPRIIREAQSWIRQQPQGSALTLTDVTDMEINPEIIQAFKDFTLYDKPYIRASAVVGIRGLMKIAYNAVMAFSGRRIPCFDTRDEALAWLMKRS